MLGDAVVSGDGWRLDVPPDLIARSHKAWGYDSGAIARGWIGQAPVTVIVQVKQLEAGFNVWVRRFASIWLEHQSRRVRVPGATDEREHCIAICAMRRRRAVPMPPSELRPKRQMEGHEPLLGGRPFSRTAASSEVGRPRRALTGREPGRPR
jgi:hypothetical protein